MLLQTRYRTSLIYGLFWQLYQWAPGRATRNWTICVGLQSSKPRSSMHLYLKLPSTVNYANNNVLLKLQWNWWGQGQYSLSAMFINVITKYKIFSIPFLLATCNLSLTSTSKSLIWAGIDFLWTAQSYVMQCYRHMNYI